jgi:hypothetical protein
MILYIYGGFKPSEKYESQLGWLHIPNIWRNKIHVPNHQPDIIIIYIYICNIYIYTIRCLWDKL